jgi:carbamoyl-phosphate synthase large subunit
LKRQTDRNGLRPQVRGLMNVQFAIEEPHSDSPRIYVLEVNPRASRTVPFVAKTIGQPLAAIAAKIMAGESLASFGLVDKPYDHIAVKEAVFPFARFAGVDTMLGPEMRSTGEVMGLDWRVRARPTRWPSPAPSPRASWAAAWCCRKGCAFVSVKEERQAVDRRGRAPAAEGRLQGDPGHRGTCGYLAEQGLESRAGQEGARGPSAHRRRDEERRASSWCSTPPRASSPWKTASRSAAPR